MEPMPALELVPPPGRSFGVLGRSTLDAVIDGGQLSMVFQPIVHGASRRVLGYEALVRCPSKYFDTPQALLREAAEAGRSGELGRLLREMAIRECPHAPLFLNVIPNEFDDPWLVRPDDPIFRHKHPVYLEIVESVPLDYFEQCQSVLAEVRKKGARLAIDDFGSGFSNVKYIADLEPEIVKFDRKLIAGLTMDSRSFRLVESLVRLCRDLGSEVVAEGVETVNEFGAVLRAGVDYCQGYFFGHPGRPAPDRVC
jgi:EAL domain-containing protein (putative c-di-GMP-specific phosphodiesterase class I)